MRGFQDRSMGQVKRRAYNHISLFNGIFHLPRFVGVLTNVLADLTQRRKKMNQILESVGTQDLARISGEIPDVRLWWLIRPLSLS